ncbi:phosphatase PAP2 family protein [Streptomyces avicenniae]|uniref:phosphatase PAP2 family protein n=1 Tax=Streptomyces avicenniae TaxID=500153 RepID=UPI000DA5F2A0|nr:phosphatase PAP2 family protein [Streptomyces avicenniae]
MAALDNPDVELDILHGINGLADRLPGPVADTVAFLGEYGIPLALVALVCWAWFLVRRHADAATAVAGLLWAGIAAGVARLVNIPIADFVARPRPFVDHPGELTVLVEGKGGWSFVSDHASAAMAVAIALFLVHRGVGLVALALALCQGFTRVFVGVHYPSDVIGGFALGMAVALLLAPAAMAVLTPLVRGAGRTRAFAWLTPRPASGGVAEDDSRPEPRQKTADPGLAA